jgi:hypothetical protein
MVGSVRTAIMRVFVDTVQGVAPGQQTTNTDQPPEPGVESPGCRETRVGVEAAQCRIAIGAFVTLRRYWIPVVSRIREGQRVGEMSADGIARPQRKGNVEVAVVHVDIG